MSLIDLLIHQSLISCHKRPYYGPSQWVEMSVLGFFRRFCVRKEGVLDDHIRIAMSANNSCIAMSGKDMPTLQSSDMETEVLKLKCKQCQNNCREANKINLLEISSSKDRR
mmetsp:Transcript_7559/g.13628  ORF Transcript_7559/g.13628 Transcript_7559/m.13628 type:complete len:111 (-) Transcript_7559:520-852(-)